jgi:hypothetical protein
LVLCECQSPLILAVINDAMSSNDYFIISNELSKIMKTLSQDTHCPGRD